MWGAEIKDTETETETETKKKYESAAQLSQLPKLRKLRFALQAGFCLPLHIIIHLNCHYYAY